MTESAGCLLTSSLAFTARTFKNIDQTRIVLDLPAGQREASDLDVCNSGVPGRHAYFGVAGLPFPIPFTVTPRALTLCTVSSG